MLRLRLGTLRREGAQAYEQALHARIGTPIGRAAEELGVKLRHGDCDTPGVYAQFRADLASGRWWFIAFVHPNKLHETQAEDALPSSRHGILTDPYPLHAIVLADSTPTDFVYLDPWFAAGDQPRRIRDDTLRTAFSGMFLPARL